MLFSFYSLDIAVIQYWTFSRVRLLTPTVILIFPIPVSSYSMIIIRSNSFWFAFPGFGFLTDTFLAPVKIESIVILQELIDNFWRFLRLMIYL